MMVPLISVMMGTLYASDHTAALARSVDSILAQTMADFEFLICDDGSSTAAMELLDRYAAKDCRIRLIRPGGRITLPQKLNACLAESRGEYIARMDDDDFSWPDRFEKQMEYLRRHSEIAFVGCNVRLYRDGEEIGCRRFPEYPEVQDFYMTQPFIHPALMFRGEALRDVGDYSEDRRQLLCEDYDLLLRLYEKGYCGYNLQENLFTYTVSTNERAKRSMRCRWNEAVTRYQRFRALGKLPLALPYVIKPLAAGLLPEQALKYLRQRKISKD